MAAEDRTPLIARLLPSSLRSRLTLTILLTNVSLVTAGALVLAVFASIDQPARLEREASAALGAVARSIGHEIALVDAIATSAAVSPGFGSDASPDPTAEVGRAVTRLEGVLANTESDAALLFAPDGQVLAVIGQAPATTLAESLVRTAGLVEESGLIGLDERRLAAMSVRALGSAEHGWLAIVREIDIESLSRASVDFSRTGRAGPDDTPLPALPSQAFSTAVASPTGNGLLVRGELVGIDGRPAGWVAVALEDERGFADLLGLSFLVAAGLAVVVGLIVGVGLTVLVRQPLEALIAHVRRHGHAALEGHAVTHLERDPMLPVEFTNLADVYDGLLEHLARRQAEVAEATSALRSAVDDSSEAKLLVRDERVALVNAAATTLLGIPAGSPLAAWDDVLESLTVEDEDGASLAPDDLLAAACAAPIVVKLSRPGLPTRWVEVRAVRHDDSHETTLLTGRDVTEQRRIDAVRDEIVSLVSHDLRAPLTVIGGYLDLLERPLPDDTRAEAVSSARRSKERMEALLEDLLTATRAEELFTPTVLEPVSLSALAEETAASFEHASAHRISATTTGDGIVLGEERRLRQVLVNLVTNAIKHAPETGAINIEVGSRDGRVRAAIQDDGPGVPEADREVIFERFTRLADGSENRPGIGLGLYIVRAIVESHGGIVSVGDRPDGSSGARFVVDLPEAPPTA